MNLVYASLLLHSANKPINEANVKKIAEATGEKVEDTQIKALVAALDGVDIKSVIEKAAMSVAAAPSAPAGEAKEKKAEKKEENTEKKAEEAAAGLGALFG